MLFELDNSNTILPPSNSNNCEWTVYIVYTIHLTRIRDFLYKKKVLKRQY